eukprot:g3985.t1
MLPEEEAKTGKDNADEATGKSKKYPILFLPGTSQNAASCHGRMEILTSKGWECHALNLTHNGKYLTSYFLQMDLIKSYIETQLDGRRPVIIGHSQGGSKAQMYLLGKNGDKTAKNRVKAVVLLASTSVSMKHAVQEVNLNLLKMSPLRTLLASMLGALHFETTSFVFGGGPRMWQWLLGTYSNLFMKHTTHTTLLGGGSQGVPASVYTFSKRAIDSHDPAVVDLQTYPIDAEPEHIRDVWIDNDLRMIHLVAENDRIVPRSQSDRISQLWGIDQEVIQGQGHQMGDSGWEEDVMGPVLRFLNAL